MENNMIESARIMAKGELADFLTNISQLYSNRKSTSRDLLLKSKVLLFDAYDKYEIKNVTSYINEKKEIREKLQFWNEKKCRGCGSKLNLVEHNNGQFWGCPSYRNKEVGHTTFNINTGYYLSEQLQKAHVRINTHWATDILKSCNLKTIIKAKELIEFYTENGYEDLREKYGYKTTIESISGYINANRNSKLEEDEITNHLIKIFPAFQVQMGIRYKLVNQVEKVAILDLILSDNDIVNIIEIKRSTYDIRPEQLKLYHSLINFVMRAKKDKRICQAVFLVYNTETYPFSDDVKYILYDNIKGMSTKEELLNIFSREAQVTEN